MAIDPETFAQWKADHGKPPAAAIADLRGEAIKKFAILDEDFTEAGGQLTPTMKLRRHIVMEQ